MRKLGQFLITFFVGMACANFTLAKAAHDPCDDLPGNWSGKGELQYFFFNCKYESTAVVTGEQSNTANVQITKTEGSILCPSQGEQTVAVSCLNGRVEMKDAKIDVAGEMSPDGQSASLEGNLYAFFRYHPFKLSVTKD